MSLLRFVLQILTVSAVSVSVVNAHGSSAEYGACFELSDGPAGLCVPVRMTRIEVSTVDGAVSADFADPVLAVTVKAWSNTAPRLPKPDPFPSAFVASKTASGVDRFKTEPQRKAISHSGECSVPEDETAGIDVTEFFSEILCDAGILQILMTPFSDDIADGDFRKAAHEIRLLISAREDVLANLHPYNEMDRADVQ